MSIETSVETAAPTAPLPSLDDVAKAVSALQTGGTEETVEAAPEVALEATPEPAQKDDKFAGKFAALSRRDKELRAREAQVEARIKALESQDGEITQKRALLDNLKKAPLKTLKELGLSYQDITNDVLGGYKEPEIDPVEARFQALDAKLGKMEELEKRIESMKLEAQDKQYQEAEATLGRNIADTVAAQAEEYQLVAAAGAEGKSLVREVMQQHWETHKEVLTITDACSLVEKYYEEETLAKFLATSKVQKMMAAKATIAAPKPTPKPEAKSHTTLRKGHDAAPEAVSVDGMQREDAINYLIKKHSMK